jgi:hypothetical protein
VIEPLIYRGFPHRAFELWYKDERWRDFPDKMSNMLKEADEQKKPAVFGGPRRGKQIVSFDEHHGRKSTTTPHRLKHHKLVYEVNIEKMYQTNRETKLRREWCFHVACTTFLNVTCAGNIRRPELGRLKWQWETDQAEGMSFLHRVYWATITNREELAEILWFR